MKSALTQLFIYFATGLTLFSQLSAQTDSDDPSPVSDDTALFEIARRPIFVTIGDDSQSP